MSFGDAVRLALRSAGRRFGRAVLTVVAVALTATLLTALLTIASTAETRVLGQLSKGGPLAGINVAAAAPGRGALTRDNPREGAARDIDDAALARISAVPNVRVVVRVVATGMLIVPPPDVGRSSRAFGESVVGVDLTHAADLPISVLSGRLPVTGSTTEVAVTEDYLQRIGLDRTQADAVVGGTLVLASGRQVDGAQNVIGRWTKATIVGVVAQEAGDGDLLASIELTQAAREWEAGGTLTGEQSTSPYTGLFVVANGLDRVGPVRAAINDIGYSTSAPENIIESVRRYLRVVEIVLAGIGTIALAIAAIGITNAMLAAVRERRREIGVLKAIGARDRDVLRVFLVEAGLLGLVGGLLGTAAGWSIARLVGEIVNRYLVSQGLVGVQVDVESIVVAGGVLGSTILDLLAGVIPARRAARLPAREAVDAW
jgi:cell division protein FtsX